MRNMDWKNPSAAVRQALPDIKNGVSRGVLYTIITTSTFVCLFGIAPIFYFISYQIYVPYPNISLPVDLQFGLDSNATAIVDTTPVTNQLSKADYSLSVVMELPRDGYNSKLGNFMVSVSIIGSSNINRSRFSILPYKSSYLELFDTVIFSPLYLFNFYTQTETLDLEMFDWPGKYNTKPTSIGISLDRIVNINSFNLVWNVKWKGIRRFMYNYRIISFFIGTLFFLTLEIISALFVAFVITFLYGDGDDDIIKTISEQQYHIFNPPRFSSASPAATPKVETPLEENINKVLENIGGDTTSTPVTTSTEQSSESDTDDTEVTSSSARLRGVDILPTPEPESPTFTTTTNTTFVDSFHSGQSPQSSVTTMTDDDDDNDNK